jgi:hypothetical protein
MTDFAFILPKKYVLEKLASLSERKRIWESISEQFIEVRAVDLNTF